MQKKNVSSVSNWPNLVIIMGGLLMAVLWLLFTKLHGPTSFNRDGHWLGGDPLFWGMMMSAPASILISLGLVGHYRLLAGDVSHKARIGFMLVMIGLVVPALVDFVTVALGPPLLLPLLAIGLLMLGLARREPGNLPQTCQQILLLLGVLLAVAALSFFIPTDVLDQYNGYRIYGILVNFIFGGSWVVFGVSLAKINPAE
jgi:hypothetical protein